MDINLLDYKIKEYMSSLPEFQVREFSYRMSKAGDCPRLMDYAIQRGEVKPEPAQALRMYFGTHIHAMWREIFEKMFPDDFHGAEEEIEYVHRDPVFTISGHPDGQIKSLDAVYELKSVSDNSFTMITSQGHAMPMHYEQANLYAHVVGRNNILFHYFNKNNSESMFLSAPYSREIAESTIQKFAQRKINADNKVIADRPYTDPTSSPCWFCRYKAECYNGYANEVSAMKAEQLDAAVDDRIYESTALAWNMRSLRLESDKSESTAKAAIADALIKRGISSAAIGEFTIDIKLGSKNNPIVTVKEKK